MLNTKYNFKKSRWRNRAITTLLAVFLFFTALLPALAQEVHLYEEAEHFPVTKGVMYEGKTLFTSLGWQKVHILRVDLSSQNVDIDTIIGKNGLSQRSPLSKMVIENGAVAGINADFFVMSTPSAPVGGQVTGGRLVSSPSNRKDMASFALTFDNIPQIFFTDFSGNVQAPNGGNFEVGGINKLGDTYGKIFIYTADYGTSTPAIPAGSQDLTFAVTKNSKVTHIFDGRTAEIPSDGIVLAARNGAANFIKNNFRIGDDIKLNLNVSPNIESLKMSVGGGAILVEDGKAKTSFTHDVPGQNPRTTVGFTADKKTMIMVVVDGRQAQSRGMTQAEMAELMLKLGAFNALNLDGGGSSTMVVRPLGEKLPRVINSVSQGVQRLITNGIGIFSRAPQGTVNGLKIVASSFNIPKNGHRTFEVRAYDENYNPVDIDQRDIIWSVTNGLGTFDGNILFAQKSGIGMVTASYRGVTSSQEIRVLKDAALLSIKPGQVRINPKDKISFDVILSDIEGYKTPLESIDIKWNIEGQIGSITGKELSAPEMPASGAVIANFSGLKTGAPVQVGLGKISLDDFERAEGKTAVSFPADVGTSFSIAPQPQPVYSGQYSGMLSYDFSTSSAATRAAYLSFNTDTGISLPAGTEKIGLWVYGQEQGHWLRAIIKDAAGTEHTIDLAKEINWLDWNWVEASLPKGKPPFSLKRIYIVTTDSTKTDSGAVYFDDLTAMISEIQDTSLVPKTPLLKDSANSRATNAGSIIGVFGDLLLNSSYDPSYKRSIDIAAQIFAQHKTKMNMIAGRPSGEGKPVAAYPIASPLNVFKAAGSGYSTHIDNEAAFIFLDSSKGSLRSTDYNQWIRLQQDLKTISTKTNTVFVVMDRSPDAFSDPLEGDLLKKLLSEHVKNNDAQVWVLYGGNERFSKQAENGVHYAALPGVNSKEPAAVVFNIKDKKVNYQVHPIIQRVVNETPSVKKGTTTDLKVYGISPTNQKILLGYPYAVNWKLSSDKIGTLYPEIPAIKGENTGLLNITAKTALAGASFNVDITDITVKINGKEILFPDQQPYINKNQRTMVPVRFVSESLGARVGWNNTTKTATIMKGDKTIMLSIGSNKAIVNGKSVEFDTRAEFKNDRNMVPLRFISEVLGAKVVWNSTTRTVDISQ